MKEIADVQGMGEAVCSGGGRVSRKSRKLLRVGEKVLMIQGIAG